MAVLLTGGAALWRMNKTAPEPDKEVLANSAYRPLGDERDPTFSPDGSQVAFAWGPVGANPDIYVKLMGPGEPIRLTNTPEDERMPQWSPDGSWIAFQRSRRLGGSIVAIPALGGPGKVIAQDKVGYFVSWWLRCLSGNRFYRT